jgi:hypothetical protein
MFCMHICRLAWKKWSLPRLLLPKNHLRLRLLLLLRLLLRRHLLPFPAWAYRELALVALVSLWPPLPLLLLAVRRSSLVPAANTLRGNMAWYVAHVIHIPE